MVNGQRYHFAPKFLFGCGPLQARGPERSSLLGWALNFLSGTLACSRLRLAKWPEHSFTLLSMPGCVSVRCVESSALYQV